MQTPVSVVLITKNAATELPKCLESCRFADEIIVVDSGSDDGTVAVAQSYGAKVVLQDWLGFGPQKQFAVQQAHNDWVLCLDADEWLSKELSININKIMSYPQFSAYRFARTNKFMGRFLRHGEGYPDKNLRLFDRRLANWSDDLVHEYVVTSVEIGELEGDLMHESGEDIYTYLNKQNRYTSIQAQILFSKNKQVSIAKMLFSPFFRFIKFYFVKLGFLDGLAGFVHTTIGCMNSFVKYAKLRELYRLGSK